VPCPSSTASAPPSTATSTCTPASPTASSCPFKKASRFCQPGRALHQANWLPGTLAGLAFAWALYGRRRLGDAIAAHATTNALLTVSVIATGAWASWG
jgi:hypothetical protein